MPKISKEEAAKILGMSTRTLERNADRYQQQYGIKIEHEQGRTKRVPTYDHDQIVALAERLKAPITSGQILAPGEIATQSDINDNGDKQGALVSTKQPQAVALVEHLTASLDRQHEDAERIIAALSLPQTVKAADKIMLTLADASLLTSLSTRYLSTELRAGKLKGKIVGRGWKIKRTDLDAYVKKL
jgi:excisionase family DNA binding protein